MFEGSDVAKLLKSEIYTTEWLEAKCSDRAKFTVLSAKANIESWEDDMTVPQSLYVLREYFTSIGDIQLSSLGVHLQGKSQVPHWHYHVVVLSSSIPKTLLSNPSVHRKAWRNKTGKDFGEASIRVQQMSLTDPVINIMSYPLKERLTFVDGREFLTVSNDGISDAFYQLILDYGNKLFQEASLMSERRERHEKKSLTLRQEILDLVEEHKPKTMDEVFELIEDVYLPTKTIDNIPIMHNLDIAITQVCVMKKIISFRQTSRLKNL